MISFDPFYLLLLLELLLIQSALITFLYLKERKVKISTLESVSSLKDSNRKEDDLQVNEEETQDQGIASEQPDPPPIPNEETEMKEIGEAGEIVTAEEEIQRLKKTVEEKVEIILELKNKIEGMENKFVDMEKEYLILFDQSQKQEEALKQYEGGYKRKDDIEF